MDKGLWVRVAGAILLASYTALDFTLNTLGVLTLGFKWLPVIAFVAFVVIMFSIIINLSNQLKIIRERIPRLIVKDIKESYLGNYYFYQNKELKKVESIYYTKIDIANIPIKPELGIKAKQVFAEISFWDYPYSVSHHNRHYKMAGRWAETSQIIDGGKPIEIEQIDLEPNGRGFCLDIGVKCLDEDEFYGINNETFTKQLGFRDKDRKLDKGVYSIQVQLMCEGIDTSFWFKLENFGKDKEVKFTRIWLSDSGKGDYQLSPRF